MRVIKAESHEGQMKQVDKILHRMLSKPAVKLTVTPMPVGGYLEKGNGTVFGWVAPWEGAVLGGAIFVEQKHKDSTVDIALSIRERETGQQLIFRVASGLTLIEKQLQLVRGDRLVGTVESDMPEELFGTFISVLFAPQISNFQKIWDPAEIRKEIEDASP